MTDTMDRNDAAAPWWARGNFAPIGDELIVQDLPVEGEIPSVL